MSTEGNGIHFWFEVHRDPGFCFTAREVNVACLRLQDLLLSEFRSGKWNIPGVEIKALAPELDEATRQYKAGQNCRMPRESVSRRRDWMGMARITVNEIDHMEPVKSPVLLPFPAVKASRPCVQGSTSMFRVEHYRQDSPERRLGLRMSLGTKGPTSDGHVVVTEDYGIALHVVLMAHARPNASGTNPRNRIRSLWEAYVAGAEARGLTARSWSPN